MARKKKRATRWLILPLGLLLVLVAGYVLFTLPPPAGRSTSAVVAGPHDREGIREDSRQRLVEILREADDAEPRR